MQVIAEHGKAQNIQGEDPNQFFQPFADPLFAMGVVFSLMTILATEKRASHAAVNQMKRLNLIFRTNLRPLDSRHRPLLCAFKGTCFPWPHPAITLLEV